MGFLGKMKGGGRGVVLQHGLCLDNGSIGRNKERAGEVVGYGTIGKKQKNRILNFCLWLRVRGMKKRVRNYDFDFLGIASGHPLYIGPVHRHR